MNRLLSTLMLLIPLCIFAQSSRDIPLENPRRTATVTIHGQKGAMNIQGWDEPMVRFSIGGDVPYTLNQDENEITIQVSEDGSGGMSLFVPRNCNLVAKSFQWGAIHVENISGTVEIDSYNGAVSASDLSGSAVISAWNGAISASFKEVSDAPMAFTSYNGAISLSLPANANANVRASLQNGRLYSAFNEGEEPQYDMENTDSGREKWQVLQIGNGGPEYRIKSLNGGVSIQRN